MIRLEYPYTIKSTDVDMYRRLRLSSLFSLLQEAAISHTIQIGIGHDKTLDRGLLWVVTQQTADITRMPVYDETVTISTWPGKSLHVFFPRFWRITDKAGSTLIEASSYWVLMEEKTRKITFPETHKISIDEYPDPINKRLPGRLRLQGGTQTGRFTVPFSYADLNGHMNNARYFDVAQDNMPQDLLSKTPSKVSIEYIGEARLGDTVTLFSNCEPDRFSLIGRAEKPVFQLQMLYPSGT